MKTTKKRVIKSKSKLAVSLNWQENVFFTSGGRLLDSRISLLMTLLVMSIGLSLAGGFYVLLKNIHAIFATIDMGRQISLFLYKEVAVEQALSLVELLKSQAGVAEVVYISEQQALMEFQKYSGFGEALKALDFNPLPSVIQVFPEVEQLINDVFVRSLQSNQGIEFVQVDKEWVLRLQAIMQIATSLSYILAFFFALAVILIVGNSIRLELQTRRDEIVIEKLIGASPAYIYKPFIYTGLWYGFLSGLLSWGIINALILILKPTVLQLLNLYQSEFSLLFMDIPEGIVFIILSSCLGVLGSLLAAYQQIYKLHSER